MMNARTLRDSSIAEERCNSTMRRLKFLLNFREILPPVACLDETLLVQLLVLQFVFPPASGVSGQERSRFPSARDCRTRY